MTTQHSVPKTLDTSMKGLTKLKLSGALLTTIALLCAGHSAIQLIELFAGHPTGLPVSVLYIEAAVGMALGMVGFGMLVASAEPFDETDQPPMLKYEDARYDPFE